MSFIKWLKQSMEDDKGQASGRRITAYLFVFMTILAFIAFTIIIALMVFKWIPLNDKSLEAASLYKDFMYFPCGMVLMLWGVVTWQNVQNFKNAAKFDPPVDIKNPEKGASDIDK